MADPSNEAVCQTCNESVIEGDEPRVATTVENGAVVYHEFCSTDCLDAWNVSKRR